jgi:hypothetical protein
LTRPASPDHAVRHEAVRHHLVRGGPPSSRVYSGRWHEQPARLASGQDTFQTAWAYGLEATDGLVSQSMLTEGLCSPQKVVSASHIVAYRQTVWSRAAARFIADRRLATTLRQATKAHDLAPRARSQSAGTTGAPQLCSPTACFVEPPSRGGSSFEESPSTGLLSADASAAGASGSSGARRMVFRPSGAHLRSVDAPSAVVLMDVHTPRSGHEDRLHRA